MLQNIVTLATNKPNYGMLQSPTSGSQRPTAGLRIENQQSLAKVGSVWRQGRQQNRGRSEVTKEGSTGRHESGHRQKTVNCYSSAQKAEDAAPGAPGKVTGMWNPAVDHRIIPLHSVESDSEDLQKTTKTSASTVLVRSKPSSGGNAIGLLT